MLRTSFLLPALLPALLLAAPAAARDAKDQPPKLPPLFQQVLDCKTVADPQARLACYDEKVTALAAATEKRDVVVTDRAEIRQTKRGLFGFAIPLGRLFGGGDGKDDADDEVRKLDTSVESAHYSRGGAMVITLKEGGTWEQIDTVRSFPLVPRSGDKVTVSRGTFGSYFVSVGGQAAVKMRRIQ